MACYFITALTQPHFGEIVRAGRKAKGWRTLALASAATGIHQRLWSDAEAGRGMLLRNAVRLLTAIDDGIGP